jgi:general secretion pathway protein L
MPDSLLIHFNPASHSHTWSTVSDAGELTSKITQGTLEQAAELAQSNKVIVLLDNAVLHLGTLDLPAMNQQKLQRAIPFALEEQLADDIEDMHFVFARDDKQSPVAVAAIARNTMRSIVDAFTDAGITPAAILPDCLCLAANASQWCALFHGEQVNFQYGSHVGSEYDRDLFPSILKAMLTRSAQQPQKLFLFNIDGEQAADISDITGDDIEVVQVSYNSHPLVVYCGNTRQAMPLNLLQHEFKPARSGGTIAWRRWSLAAGLAAAWLITNMGISAWQLQQLNSSNAALEAEIVNIYRTTFPKSKRVINPRVQMEQKLNELKAGGTGLNDSIVNLIANTAPALSLEKTVTLRNISYRNGRLDITVNSNNLNSIQLLNTRLNETEGISSEIVSSSSENNAVTGSIRIQQAAS